MKNVINAVEKYRDLMVEAEKYIWERPETGFREVQASAYMAAQFEKLGYTLTYAEEITGFCTEIDTGRAGPTVLVLAELDAVLCPAHPDADPTTGAVHACGHHAQCAAMLGVAGALKDEKVRSGLCGKIRLCCVPAEECIETEYRQNLRKAGKIKYLGGKCEFLSRGLFDGVDLAFMVHSGGGRSASVNLGGDDGFVAKTVRYKGKTAHDACGAWLGKNALYAAINGLNAANALRETFQDWNKVRWSAIITRGGEATNNIPDETVVEGVLRAANYEALERENKKINRALIGAALSFGAQVEIDEEFGYAPLHNDERLSMLAKEAFDGLGWEYPCGVYGQGQMGAGATDMGDLSAIMPVIHPYIGGAIGQGHGADWRIENFELACVMSAKWQTATIKLLLENGGARAKEIIDNYKPSFSSKEEFLVYKDGWRKVGDRLVYRADDSVEVLE